MAKDKAKNMRHLLEEIQKNEKEEPEQNPDSTPKSQPVGNESKEIKSKSMLEGLTKNKPAKQYSSFRMHSDVLEKYKEIAEKENIKYPGELIHKILENFINEYESEKD